MKFPKSIFALCLAAVFVALSFSASPAEDKKMTAEEVVSRHLESIGGRAERAAVKSRLVQGPLKFVVRTGSPYTEETVGRVLSMGAMFRYTVLWPRNPRDRKEEEIIFDGERVATGFLQYQKGLPLSDFLYRYQEPLKEGLLGGVLSTTWPLTRMEEMQPRLEYKGLKKAQGHDAHALDYRKRKGLSDLKLTLFFDAETFRHIRSEYLFQLDNTFGTDADASSRLQGTRRLLTEEFDDFREVDGLTLPHRYKLQLTSDMGNRSTVMDWEITAQKLSHKEPVEEGLFKVK